MTYNRPRNCASMLHLISPITASGKTVWAVGLIRALLHCGLQVRPFKAIGEGEPGPGNPVCSAALHMAAAAELTPDADLNPVVVMPVDHDHAEVWLFGDRLGTVRRVGRDMPILTDLGPAAFSMVQIEIQSALERCRAQSQLVISEGAGAATELNDIGVADIANIQLGAIADATVLVARTSRGGALAALHGCYSRLPVDVVSRLRGVVLNDVRVMPMETARSLAMWAETANLEVLSILPRLSFFDGRSSHDAFTAGSREDHDILGAAVGDSLHWMALASWLGFSL